MVDARPAMPKSRRRTVAPTFNLGYPEPVIECLTGVMQEEPTVTLDQSRFVDPLYTIAEAADVLKVPPSTLSTWARGYARRSPGRPQVRGEPLITHAPVYRPRHPYIPFVGLAEAAVLAAIRRSGVPVHRVSPAINELERGLGVRHALASRKLYTDGAELLCGYVERHPDAMAARAARRLIKIRDGECAFLETIAECLSGFRYAPDGYVDLFRAPGYGQAEVVVDPFRSSGAPIFARGGYRVMDVLYRYRTGESVKELTEEFGVPRDHVEDAIRVASG